MITEHEKEAGPVTVQIGVCSVCHALFMLSGERLTSPCHGADPLAVLATLTIGPDGAMAGFWGSHRPRSLISREEAIQHFIDLGRSREWAEDHLGPEEPAPAAAPREEPPAEEAPGEAPETIKASELLPVVILAFLTGDEAADAESLKGVFIDAGVDAEPAATAVGRLVAVRELLQTLAPPREAVPVAPAPPEAESSPENT